jgi:hypothetical protein
LVFVASDVLWEEIRKDLVLGRDPEREKMATGC